ncbi:protein of unknown function (plasmid) [Caballeronia sp. S22]
MAPVIRSLKTDCCARCATICVNTEIRRGPQSVLPSTFRQTKVTLTKYPKAVEKLTKDRNELLAFYNPGGALAAPEDNESDRAHLRHGAPSHEPRPKLSIARNAPRHGVQAC